MSKNKLTDLNDHLFMAIERLGDEDIKGADLSEEINRAQAIGQVSKCIVENARLALDAQKAIGETISSTALPPMLQSK